MQKDRLIPENRREVEKATMRTARARRRRRTKRVRKWRGQVSKEIVQAVAHSQVCLNDNSVGQQGCIPPRRRRQQKQQAARRQLTTSVKK
ncbi:hypothetical protein E4U38_007194 [Claviceps purpurea]|nr:hypothetical protein E4U38_007194 [Claviceps purpurea]KAG6184430.1 hypothetical protein E4U27_000963 [Claviceps purpurea]KAG6238176.1 hypothetical protein E4U25_001963 [Claviceps purpurea]KAG6257052.1 hypothetical protein E4U23_008352 [Claviceps purpurea]